MRYLTPVATKQLERHSPTVWTSTGEDPGFIFEVAPEQSGFLGFFLWAGRGETAPKIALDQGAGFNDLTALSMKRFPFAFYHLAPDKMRGIARLRFRPSIGPATFRFLPLALDNAVLVAVLHYLFNLRYQKIGVMAPRAPGRRGTPEIKETVARIVRFFRDVSIGGGVRVQEGSADILPVLKLSLSLQANAAQSRMDALLGGGEPPLLSFVVPTYNTSTIYLADLLDSFAVEKAAYAELILSDDGSTRAETLAALTAARTRPGVSVILNRENKGIAAATNAGLAAARGAWVSFIDHDDQFVPGAVATIAQAIVDHPDAMFFYTDEIIADAALRPVGSFCKPAFDSVLLSGVNFINHFSVFRRARVEAIGGLRIDREGSQDYDLLLRYLKDAAAGSVVHIPFLAYLWRREEGTYSDRHLARSVASARRALREVFVADGAAVDVVAANDPALHRLVFAAERRQPVSVIVPNKNSLGLISALIPQLRAQTAYPALEIVIVDNGSDDPAVLDFYAGLTKSGAATVDIQAEPFNFAAMCNRGARLAGAPLLLFLNNDIEVQDPAWLAEMVDCLAFSNVGIVGAKLLYPDGLVQHDGVIVGLGGAAGHWYIGEAADSPGPMSRLNVRQTLTAVTGACMLVTRACFDAVGGFDAETFPIAYNDVDLCLRAKAAGFRTVWTPFAQLIHHESASRGSDESGANNARFREETARLQARHGTADYLDDAYSPFYDKRYATPHLALPKQIPSPRANTFPW